MTKLTFGYGSLQKKTPQGSSFPFNFINLFHEFIAFLSYHVVLLGSPTKGKDIVFIP
jgi:hypothetical protein